MSKYQEKVLSGKPSDPSDWVEYLKAAHRVAPAMSPKAFDAPKTVSGKNSYQILVDAVRNKNLTSIRVLDLACGDGHLVKYLREAFGDDVEIVGIDMSEVELAVAKARHKNSKLSFKQESADSISEPDQSFDLVLCHMAFMLMNPVEPVLQEVARILKPDGVFSGVVGGGPARGGFLLTYQRILADLMKSEYPNHKLSSMGDSRTRSADGLISLIGPPLFKATTVSDFEIIVKTSPQGAARFFEDMYTVSLLPPADRKKLKSELIAHAKTDVSYQNDEISFEFPMRLFVAERV